MRNRARLRLHSRRGQGLVEFVLVAPVLLLLIFGMVELARAWNIRHVITDAAREGARIMASMHQDQAAAQTAITDALAEANLDYAQATVTYEDNVMTPAGNGSRVTIQYPHTLRFLGLLPQKQLQISSQFMMWNEP